MSKQVSRGKNGKFLSQQQRLCLECRECCEYVEIPTSVLGGIEVLDYWVTRGTEFYISQIDGLMHVRIYQPCRHLTPLGCAIYEKRPFACQKWICSEKNSAHRRIKEEACHFSIEQVKKLIQQHKESQNDDLQHVHEGRPAEYPPGESETVST